MAATLKNDAFTSLLLMESHALVSNTFLSLSVSRTNTDNVARKHPIYHVKVLTAKLFHSFSGLAKHNNGLNYYDDS